MMPDSRPDACRYHRHEPSSDPYEVERREMRAYERSSAWQPAWLARANDPAATLHPRGHDNGRPA